MKKLLLGSIALVCTAAAGPGVAADLPVKAPAAVPMTPTYNWSGLYIGAHIGAAFPGSDFFGNDNARLMGGGQVGADFQFASSWVFGVEANYSFIATDDAVFPVFANRNLGSVTGRLAYAWGPVLLYGKGGYGWADTRRSFGFTGNANNGYTVGGGLEYMLVSNWSLKLEYQYYNFGDLTFVSPPPVVVTNFTNDEHTIKLGANYRFNWGGAPVRY
jgi:outer membrane immunogenic protein